jgi:hypothetical protein
MACQDSRRKACFCTVFFILLSKSVFPQSPQGKPKSISNPSRLFNVPTAYVLRTGEILISGGSSFGMESKGSLVRNLTIGLGGIAEAEISTTGQTNQLTGEAESFAMSSFKVNLMPEGLQRYWFVPNIAVQLKSSSWKAIKNESGSIRSYYTEASSFSGENLLSLDIKERFSVLNLIVGKRWSFGGFQAGVSATDVRLKDGRRWYYFLDSAGRYNDRIKNMSEVQKNYWTPIGGIEIKANDRTQIMAEIQSVPIFDFDVGSQSVVISKAWLGVAGIRFFISNWLTLDAGVKTQSNDHGIADAEIRLGGNCVIPVYDVLKKAMQAVKDWSRK